MRLLWLSDIHFRASYQEELIKNSESEFNVFISSFIEIVKKNYPFDYIILTGDLAFSGLADDYMYLNQWILEKINNGNTIPIITVPGNHDLKWSANWLRSGKRKTIDKIIDELKNKNKILEENFPDIQDHFASYSDFCKWTLKFPNTADVDISKDYQDKRLFGYFKDKKMRVEFIIINSAWFALGDAFNKFLLDHFSDEEIGKILQLKDEFIEYQGQIIGKEKLKKVFTNAHIDSDIDYTKIILCHHPSHWMEWSERFSLEPDKTQSMVINRLLACADIFLTGHEHLPEFAVPIKLNNGHTWHFQGGKFLQDNVVEPDGQFVFKDNRFSILEVTDTEITEIRYKYFENESEWRNTSLSSNSYKFARPNKMPYSISKAMRDRIKEHYTESIDNKQSIEIFSNLGNLDIKPDVSDFGTLKSLLFKAYYQNEHIFIFCSDTHFYENLSNSPDMFDDFIRFIVKNNASGKIDEIEICSLDLFVSEDAERQYMALSTPDARANAFQNITKGSDMCFNSFKTKFFDRFSKNRSGQQVDGIDFEVVRNASFVNCIFPYWDLKRP